MYSQNNILYYFTHAILLHTCFRFCGKNLKNIPILISMIFLYVTGVEFKSSFNPIHEKSDWLFVAY